MNQLPHTMHALPLAVCATALLCLPNMADATILTVHNDPLYNAQYTSINAAVTAASAGDTLLVHGSPVGYGNINISKQLTLIGPGHDPANGNAASITNIALNAPSTGTVLEGLQFSTMSVNVEDMRIERCRVTGYVIVSTGGNNTLIVGNVFTNAYIDVSPNAANVEVRNNFVSSNSGSTALFRDGSATTLVHFNVFVRTSTGTGTTNRVFSSSGSFTVLANNVFHTATVAGINPGDCPNYSFQSNLSFSTEGAVPTLGPNNLDNVAPTWDLGGDPPLFSYAHDYTMLSGAPSTGASDGGQVGVMGGVQPLRSDGLPRNIPRVTSTQLLTPYVPVNGTIDVNFQAVQGQP